MWRIWVIEILKYRLGKFKEYKFAIYTIFLCIILIFEIYTYYLSNYSVEEEVEEEYYESSEEECELDLGKIIEELTINNLNILNVEKDEDGYNFEVSIKGSRKEIYKIFKELINYTIETYEFDIDSDNIDGKVKLSYN